MSFSGFEIDSDPDASDVPAKAVGSLSLAGKLAADRCAEDLQVYCFSTCGKTFRRSFSGRGGCSLDENATQEVWENAFKKVFRRMTNAKNGVNMVDASPVTDVEIMSDGVVIHYENKDDKPVRPKVSVYFLNRYGSIIGRIDDIWRFKKIEPKSKAASGKFPLPAVGKPMYIDVETEI